MSSHNSNEDMNPDEDDPQTHHLQDSEIPQELNRQPNQENDDHDDQDSEMPQQAAEEEEANQENDETSVAVEDNNPSPSVDKRKRSQSPEQDEDNSAEQDEDHHQEPEAQHQDQVNDDNEEQGNEEGDQQGNPHNDHINVDDQPPPGVPLRRFVYGRSHELFLPPRPPPPVIIHHHHHHHHHFYHPLPPQIPPGYVYQPPLPEASRWGLPVPGHPPLPPSPLSRPPPPLSIPGGSGTDHNNQFHRNLLILRSMIAYRLNNVRFPNILELHEFINNQGEVQIRADEVENRAFTLEAVYDSLVEHQGLNPQFNNPRDEELFNLSNRIWGPQPGDNGDQHQDDQENRGDDDHDHQQEDDHMD